jgi:hypothetical protein
MNPGRLLLPALGSARARTQTWLQAGKYLNALVSDLPSRNGWSVAEHAGGLVTGLPLDLRFRAKGQMAIDIPGDARCRRPHLRLRLRLARSRLPAARPAGPPQSCAIGSR